MEKKFKKNWPTKERPSFIKWIKVQQMLKFRKLSEFQNQLSDIRGKVLIIQYVKGLQRDTKKYIDEIYRLAFNKAKREIPSRVITIKIMFYFLNI